ncbi:hypothetical protein OSB04_008361 [Centaurea solstitialis]|uniref:Protein BZR1 homolog n=1 Tax=Centaurea solstitialis TaxID=347529 RepID=A0AA38TX54_9ASTR|nr:hypothetical protein OSB04_008361 [Centaurea solstitialis]
MTSGSRLPSWKERENNKRRERRRRAIAAKIFAGLRVYGNYKLPKHCDNNEVLKALCNEAGWIVEEDGTTYRKGCKPVLIESMGGSASASGSSPCSSSYQPSPNGSYNFSPTTATTMSSSIPSSSTSSLYASTDPNSLIPWLKNLSSSGSPFSSSKFPHHLYMYTGGSSISAPVTPPLSCSPTCGTPRRLTTDDQIDYPFLPASGSSTPLNAHSPGLQTDSGWVTPQEGASSPTFSLQVASFGLKEPSSTITHDHHQDVAMSDSCHEFAFGSNMNINGVVKAWEGERIHEECISDDLELTLGNPTTR